MFQDQESLETLTTEQPEVVTNNETPAEKKEKPLSRRDYDIAMKKALAERSLQLKQNRTMIEELNLEVAYWKAQVDLVKYRFEKMDYYLKNLELEPKYLAAIEAQKLKEEQNIEPKSVLS